MKRISLPIEVLMKGKKVGEELLKTDFLIVGSGYGGAVAAMRLASDGSDAGKAPERDVVVLERGKEYALGDFPYDIEDLPSHIHVVSEGHEHSLDNDAPGTILPDTEDSSPQIHDKKKPHDPTGYSDALFNLYVGGEITSHGQPATPSKKVSNKDKSFADILVGSGLGGTSLINANVAERPKSGVFKKSAWPQQIRSTENPLDTAFGRIEKLIGVRTPTESDWQRFPKYIALQKLGKAFKKAEVRPANIAVHAVGDKNALEVQQHPCTDCGNCVTGCNVGAKNSLDRNLLRLAKTRGARFYTGATVYTVEPHCNTDWPWKVVVQPTVQPKGTVTSEAYVILARNVILAAGSLGSTEILLRSRKLANLDVSDQLGKKFSTNGDGLIMSYGQKDEVGAIAEAAQKGPLKKVGPTITGILQTENLTIEDASVPAALGRVFSELVTTGAMLQRMANVGLPDFFAKKGANKKQHDPLAASMAVADHCQALLVMGDDGAPGQLVLSEKTGAARVTFPNSSIKDNAALVAANRLVEKQDRASGLDGGQYVPNPLWRLLPKEAEDADVLSGEMPVGRVISVHPLGGCAMADTAAGGVVNHRGQVFKSGGDIHTGLYVMDGAVIPAALEVNPFLTIAALAWRSCEFILDGASESEILKVIEAYSGLGEVPDRERNRPLGTSFVIQEQLVGQVDRLTPWFRRKLSDADQLRITQTDGLVVQVEASGNAAEKWLENPGMSPLNATMTLYTNPMTAEMVDAFNPVGVERAHLLGTEPLLSLQGKFWILPEQEYGTWRDFTGAINAVCTYIDRRGFPFGKKGDSLYRTILDAVKGFRIFFNLGKLQSRFRHLIYDFKDPVSGISIGGAKVLGYSNKLKRLWPGLIKLELRIKEGKAPASRAQLRVNANYLVEPGLLELRQSANLPQGLLFAGGLAAFFARCLFATNFWELGGLAYRDKPEPEPATTNDAEPDSPKYREFPALKTSSGCHNPQRFYLDVQEKDGKPATIRLLLTRYPHTNPAARPVLLLHGLAQSSQIYWTSGINNLASHLYDAGYDVWLLDYRLSSLVLPGLKNPDWSIDEIARYDIPAAIHKVCEEKNVEKILVFGHCVGACSLAMAVLAVPGLGERIEAAITNAIHPWVTMSPANRFRAKLGNFLQEWVHDGLLDPNPTEDSGALQNIMDRLAFGLSRVGEADEDKHQDYGGSALIQSICDRMTFLYGRMWNHKNLDTATHDEFAEMLGPAPISVYKQLFYYSQVRRLTDKHGENRYLERKNIREKWKFPILFIHGKDSRVFNPHSAMRSAMRLDAILNVPAQEQPLSVRSRIYKDYGHMDVIFGKEAHTKCFPEYVCFFEDPDSFKSYPKQIDWPEPYEARPITGPALRAAWVDNNRIYLRLWSELRTHGTDLPNRMVAVGGTKVQEFDLEGNNAAPLVNQRFRLLDLEFKDTPARIELAVRGEILDHEIYSAAELIYEDQSWLHRLCASSGNGYKKRMSFVVGSCRFPGTIVDNMLSDKLYAAILEHITSPDGAQLLFLVGDQIYADKTEQLFDSKSLKAKYTDHYAHAFRFESSPNFARLIQQIPTHFALDDHEIDDNWSGLPLTTPPTRKQMEEFEYAMTTAMRFIGSGRNLHPIMGNSSHKPFYYPLSHPQECDFSTFVLDTRSERILREGNDPKPYSLLFETQFKALTTWLSEAHQQHPDAPKFIICGSVIAPLTRSYCEESSTWRQQDGWAGYPQTLESLLHYIAQQRIKNIIFVGGDAHLSAVARLTVTSGQGEPESQTIIWQIVSSGIYSPMPFANSHKEDFIWKESHGLPTHLGKGISIRCENTFLSDHYQQFVRVDADASKVIVSCFDENNRQLAKQQIPL